MYLNTPGKLRADVRVQSARNEILTQYNTFRHRLQNTLELSVYVIFIKECVNGMMEHIKITFIHLNGLQWTRIQLSNQCKSNNKNDNLNEIFSECV